MTIAAKTEIQTGLQLRDVERGLFRLDHPIPTRVVSAHRCQNRCSASERHPGCMAGNCDLFFTAGSGSPPRPPSARTGSPSRLRSPELQLMRLLLCQRATEVARCAWLRFCSTRVVSGSTAAVRGMAAPWHENQAARSHATHWLPPPSDGPNGLGTRPRHSP